MANIHKYFMRFVNTEGKTNSLYFLLYFRNCFREFVSNVDRWLVNKLVKNSFYFSREVNSWKLLSRSIIVMKGCKSYIYNKRVTRAILRSIKFMLLLLIFDSIRTRFCKDLNFGVNNDIFWSKKILFLMIIVIKICFYFPMTFYIFK